MYGNHFSTVSTALPWIRVETNRPLLVVGVIVQRVKNDPIARGFHGYVGSRFWNGRGLLDMHWCGSKGFGKLVPEDPLMYCKEGGVFGSFVALFQVSPSPGKLQLAELTLRVQGGYSSQGNVKD